MTFSIVARCKKTGMFGVASSTARPAVGSLVTHTRAKVGAIATQAAVNPYFGIHGLRYLKEGLSSKEVMEKVKAEDEEFEKRQLIIVDQKGNVSGYTGEETISWSGHKFGDQFAVAGNMLVGEQVLIDMKKGYEQSEHEYLPLRLLDALEAGQKAGGDKRGKQSAAIKVVDRVTYPIVDLRVDEHEDPVTELRRVYKEAEINLFPFVESLPIYQSDI